VYTRVGGRVVGVRGGTTLPDGMRVNGRGETGFTIGVPPAGMAMRGLAWG